MNSIIINVSNTEHTKINNNSEHNKYIIIELSSSIFIYGTNTESSIDIPLEISYIVFTKHKIIEIFSTRIKYDLSLYPSDILKKSFQLYESNFPTIYRTHSFYKKYDLDDPNESVDVSYYYKNDYGLCQEEIKKSLIKKIKKYNIDVWAKDTKKINHFLNDKNNDCIFIRELKNIGMPEYININDNNRINLIKSFYEQYKDIMKINCEIMDRGSSNQTEGDFAKEKLFSKPIIEKLIDADITIYKAIVFTLLTKRIFFNKYYSKISIIHQ